MNNKIILITGATAGFGKAIAYKFAEHGWNIIITGRRNDRLKKIEDELTRQYGIKVFSLCFDVTSRKKVLQAINDLPHDWKKIDVLVNNAGLASGLSLIQDGNMDDWAFMIENKSGHIINLGSIAGKEAYLKGNIYCATKFAVDAISKSMRIDLLQHRIKVTQISPGAAETEFSLTRFHGDAERAKKAYEGYTPLTAEDIADLVFNSM